MVQLSIKEFYAIAHGSCFFASGGGGSVVTALSLIKAMEKQYENPSVEMVSMAEALSDSDCIAASVAFMGAPDSINSDFPPQDIILAFKDLNERAKIKYNKPITYLIPVETGALNIAAAYMVAIEMNNQNKQKSDWPIIKVIDADGAGRSVPTLTLLTFSTNKVFCNPSVLSKAYLSKERNSSVKTSSKSNQSITPISLSVENSEASVIEEIARDIMSTSNIFDQYAGLGIWIMDNENLKKADPVEGGISKSLALGNKLRSTSSVYEDLEINGQVILFEGTLVNVEESTAGGFDLGNAKFVNDYGELFNIYLENENIIAWKNSEETPMIMAPDSICYIAHNFLQPENCPEKIRVFSNSKNDWTAFRDSGVKISVIGLPADCKLKTREMDNVFTQLREKFGYPGKYRPINHLCEKNG